MQILNIAIFLVLMLGGCAALQGKSAPPRSVLVASPNGSVNFVLATDGGKPQFSIRRGGVTVIEPSLLNMSLDGVSLTDAVQIAGIERYRSDQEYPWYGVHTPAVDHSNAAKISLRNLATGQSFMLDVRVADDSAAYRLIIPPANKARVPEEKSQFILPAGSIVWHQGLKGHYEGVHSRDGVEQIKQGEWIGPPMTFELANGGGYASITEANLVNYDGMALEAAGNRIFEIGLGHRQPISYPYQLRFSKADQQRVQTPVPIEGQIVTPWRVVMVGADLNALVNCDAVHNLCPPPDKRLFPQGAKTSWVKPGRAVWRYLDGGLTPDGQITGRPTTMEIATTSPTRGRRSRTPTTTAEAEQFSHLAGELGFEYNVLEGYWHQWTDDQLQEVTDYSRKQGVGIWVWMFSRDLHDAQHRRELFERCQRDGVTGLKIDFFDNEAKDTVDLYTAILHDAAEHHLLCDFHGSDKPTGLSRTWPNELMREAVVGMESRRLADRATHDVTLPFTRMLAGGADYTPVLFTARRANTTWAHQIATAVVFGGPLLTYGANPRSILDNPACDVIKSIPAVWDQTIVLPPSEIGQMAVFARRSGNTWFLVLLSGTMNYPMHVPVARRIHVPLSFLGAGEYRAIFVMDKLGDSGALRIMNQTNRATDELNIILGSGGGFVARFSR